MVVEDRVGLAAPPGFELSEVLYDRHELQALPRSRRRELVETRKRRDVRRLIEHQQQRRVERSSGAGGVRIDARNDLVDQGHEQRAQTLLTGGCGAQVRSVATGEEPLGRELSANRGL